MKLYLQNERRIVQVVSLYIVTRVYFHIFCMKDTKSLRNTCSLEALEKTQNPN